MLIKNALALSLLSMCASSLHIHASDKFLSLENQQKMKKGFVYLALTGGLFCVAKEFYTAAFCNTYQDQKRRAERLEILIDSRLDRRLGSDNNLVKREDLSAAIKAEMTIVQAAQAPAAKFEPSARDQVNAQFDELREELRKLRAQQGQPTTPQPLSVASVQQAVSAIEQRSAASKPDSSSDKKDGDKAP